MIRNMIFDMGQVLIRWEPMRLIEPLPFTQEEKQLLYTELFQSVEWMQLDHGTITGEAAAKSVCARLPQKLHGAVKDLIHGWWQRPLSPMPGMEQLLGELKDAGYGIYLLSNASVQLREYFYRIPGSQYFDGLMVSSEEKMMKPQVEIFEALMQRFHLNPSECFFVDDSPANVEGALCAGIAGTIYRGDTQRLRRELAAAGILKTEA